MANKQYKNPASIDDLIRREPSEKLKLTSLLNYTSKLKEKSYYLDFLYSSEISKPKKYQDYF